MRHGLMVLSLMLSAIAAPATAAVSVGVSYPGVSIGINVPSYPQLARVPGYPVYYAPAVGGNYFFYDGMYWVYDNDNWYSSTWYNGPWTLVAPNYVPAYVLRVPVRYYRHPPYYFRGWRMDAPPRWGERWGPGWSSHRAGWDRWNRNAAPPPAPLPYYQRQYSGNRYPRPDQQYSLNGQHYRYQPRDQVVQQQYRQRHPQQPQQGIVAPSNPQQPQEGIVAPSWPPTQPQGSPHGTMAGGAWKKEPGQD